MIKLDPPSVDDVYAARERIRSFVIKTPILESPHLNKQLNGRLLVKAEPLQKSGSFKFRGALNTLLQLSNTERDSGVIAYSSGNHAQGVALAAKILGIRATILMPTDAPVIKVENTKSYGAEVVHFDRYTESREEIGERLCQERGSVLVKPYDDARVIAGQGTVGLEINEQLAEIGVTPDLAIVPCGGGGLISGVSLALKSVTSNLSIYSAEPEHYDDTAMSLTAGEIVSVDPNQASICDALLAPQPGNLTFPINRSLLSGGLVVDEDEVRNAVREAFSRLKLVVEPGGAVALAAALSKKIDVAGKTVVVVCSGGNIDQALFANILTP